MKRIPIILPLVIAILTVSAMLYSTTHSSSTAESMRTARRDAVVKRGLPDALTLRNGTKVETPELWFDERRDELLDLFQYFVYGYYPDTPRAEYVVSKVDDNALSGKATYREITINFSGPPLQRKESMALSIFTPNSRTGPIPVIIGINRCGNQSVHNWNGISMPAPPDSGEESTRHNCRSRRGSHENFWSVERVLERGFAFVTFYQGDLDGDSDDITDGLHGALYASSVEHAGDERAAWGTVAAWAWGFSRAIDYLETENEFDMRKIAVVGHSRRGKSAILAGAIDDRIALAVPHQAGTGGDALSRSSLPQEPVFLLNWYNPGWFNEIYKSYNFRIGRLPVDQHELIALVAPRSVLVTATYGYRWAGFKSSLRGMKAADKVYDLLGTPGLIGDGVVIGDEPIIADEVGAMLQYRREDGHSLDPGYWKVILDYAEIVFERV